jgi:hypothetical protein
MIRKKQPKKEIVIDLTGPDGNAFALMGYANRFARQVGLNGKEITSCNIRKVGYENRF